MLNVYAVFDVKAAAFGKMFALPARGLATRGFVDVCQDPKAPFGAHPADYALYELGTYDPNTGKMTSHPQPEVIMSASQALNEANPKKED